MELDTAKALVAAVFVGFAIAELATGRFGPRGRRFDPLVDAVCALLVPGVLLLGVLHTSTTLSALAFPDAADMLAHLPAWQMFGAFLILDDLTQYGWHRLSHSVPALYSLHRAHHSPEYLSVRVVYRNNLVYYVIMPGVWLSGLALHLGLGAVYPVYVAAKMAVIIGAHAAVPWDAPLYRHPIGRKVMAVVARIISTPSTHAAHHGRHEGDGITHYKGNFGNFLFLWDWLFGTAHITGQRPATYGLEKVVPVSPLTELLWAPGAAVQTVDDDGTDPR